MISLITKPLDTTTWSDFARLADDHRGVWDGCWCLGFHEEGRPHVHTSEQRRALKEVRVREGRAHAALVFDGGRCVGWCQFGPTDGSFLNNGTLAMFERRGFIRSRQIGKHRWVVNRHVD